MEEGRIIGSVQVDLFAAEAYDLLADFDGGRHCGE